MTHPTPVGGRIVTRPFLALTGLFLLAAGILLYRFFVGLGPVTALSDRYPWGLWIAFDVVVGTALATGGYAVAILVFILNKGKYHALIRPALVTSALGYTLGGIGVIIDIGRWWNVYKLPFSFWNWNFNSILLEVALCIMLYTVVLWIEVSPFLMERWKEGDGFLARASTYWLPKVRKALPFIVALGLLLPTMHQSSLGSLMMLAGPKVHPLWQTPMLPLLFLLSCIAMGYGVVVLEGMLTRSGFGRLRETPLQEGLTRAAMVLVVAYLVVRFADLAYRGRLGLLAEMNGKTALFAVETLLWLGALALLARRHTAPNRRRLFTAAAMMITAGALYRFSTFLIVFNPAPGSLGYFPSIGEILVTAGLVAGEIAVYILIVKKFPIVGGVRSEARPSKAAPAARPVPARS